MHWETLELHANLPVVNVDRLLTKFRSNLMENVSSDEDPGKGEKAANLVVTGSFGQYNGMGDDVGP